MLFQPSNIYPSTLSGIGAGTVDVTQGLNVSWQVNGDTPMTAYQIKIYQNDTASTLKYDSGSVSVSPAFETHDRYGNPTFYTVLLSAATLSTAGIVNGYQYGYKMLITQWWGVSDYVEQTSASVFITRSLPTISIDAIPNPVTSSSLTITATYAQAQGDPISTVDWVFALAGSESNPIKNTGAVNTQVLSFDADGLINGNTYSIMCTVVTANGMEASTGFVQFTVSYSSSSLGINYQLAQLKNSSAVYLSWDDLGSNVLSYPYTDSTKTTNGITFTVNGDGDIVATGTASADAYFTIAEGTTTQLGITAGQKFIVTSGYSGAKIVVTETNSSNVVVSTITGNDPLQYIATSTTNTLKFSIVIPSGTALGVGQQLQPMIAIENKIVALNDVSVTMQPIQDLNGYSNPWPAGGGKNKLDLSGVARATYGLTSEDKGQYYWIHGTCELSFASSYLIGSPGNEIGITIPASTEMVISMTVTGAEFVGTPYAQIDINGTTTNYPLGTPFTLSSDGVLKLIRLANAYIFSQGRTYDIKVYAQLEQGSTPTAFLPYSNICPISGLTGLSVYRTGKNLINAPDKTLTSNGYVFNLTGLSILAGTYTLSWTQQGTTTPSLAVSGENGDYFNGSVTSPYTLTVSGVITGIRLYGGPATYSNIQFELGSTATTYEPYNGNTYAVDWSTQAGTVYGGTLNVVTGVLTVDRANIASYNGETINEPWMSSMDAYVSGATPTIGAQVVYTLATPLTYQLTPQEVAALAGQNNVWSDAGDVMVSYTTDTGSQATISGPIVSFSNTNAQSIPTPQYIPGITGLSIYRYLQGELALQHVYDLATGATSILDYFAPSQTRVSYLLVAHSNVGDLFLQTNDFVPTFWFYSVLLCDTDSNGNYHVSREYIFKYGVETGAISNNNGPTIQKNFTPYPNRQPISSLYKTGKLSGYIGKTNNLNQYSDTISLQNAIFEISTSSLTKFIKSRKGDILMADTAAPIQMQTEDNTTEQALKATIDWVEVGDADQVSIVSISTDPFWPLP